MTSLQRCLRTRLSATIVRLQRTPRPLYSTSLRVSAPASQGRNVQRSSSSAAMTTHHSSPGTQPAATTVDGHYQTFTAALIQLNCQADQQHNLRQATALIRQAAAAGAKLICTPENTTRLTALSLPFDVQKEGKYESDHPIIPEYRRLAAELGVWLAIGSVSVRAEDDSSKMANRSLLIAPHTSADSSTLGTIVARYDKVHLFDAPSLTSSSSETYVESKRIRPGHSAPVVLTPFGPLALTICYDIRFPTLYRQMAALHRPTLVLIPSAFTVPTGQAHWETLLRARAIECGCYVLAAAQCGEHTGGRRTYGHSMAVGPMGDVVAVRTEETEGVLLVDIDTRKVDEARKRLPSLDHQREFQVTMIDAMTAQHGGGKLHEGAVREEKSAVATG